MILVRFKRLYLLNERAVALQYLCLPFGLLLCSLQRPVLNAQHAFLNGKLAYIMFEVFLLPLAIAVVFVLVNMASLRTSHSTLQPKTLHRLCIGVLERCEVVACHDVVGTQPGAILRLGAVTLGGFRLARPPSSLGGHDRHDRHMKVRCLLVHVQVCAHYVSCSECFFCPADTRLRPLVQPAFIGKPTQGFAVGRKQDIEREDLVLGDLACKPGMVNAVLDSLAQSCHSVGIFDEVIAVEVAQFGVGVVGLCASLDVSGDGGA